MGKRPCWVEIAAAALEDNYRLLAAICGRDVELLAIVKANAYGHGLALCAPAAVRGGARWLGVTSVAEGIAARALCPEAEILAISGPFPGEGAAAIEHRLTAVVWEPWQLEELESAARNAGCGERGVPVHLELDTGMSRQGVALGDLEAVLARFVPSVPDKSGLLRLDGVMTHLFAADESDGETTRAQLALLESALERVFAQGLRPVWLNVGNSAAVVDGRAAKALLELASRYGMRVMLRPGLALYGLTPEFTPEEPRRVSEIREQLQPILSWKTRVVSVRGIEAGQVVGYNGTFVATEPMRVALLAVGYADGLKRGLSNRGSVLLAGKRCPIVGRISMDQTVVDVTEIPDAAAGDEVVLLGRQGDAEISAEEQARLCGTIPWEIFTSIGERVERRSVQTQVR